MGRKITIVSNKTQSQHVLENSSATTLGELKQELNAAGISYEGMSFFEGHARVELKDDNSVLPSNIPYKGQTVNDLVFLLSAPDKHIKSGAMSRKEAYDEIKRQNLGEEVKKHYGRNYTQVSTEELIYVIKHSKKQSARKSTAKTASVEKEKTSAQKKQKDCSVATKTVAPVEEALKELILILRDSGHIQFSIAEGLLGIFEGKHFDIPEGMTQKEIAEMFNFVNQ